MDEVIIVGAGIGGLTLGLALQQAGIACRVYESAAELKTVGVGINLLPHATRELAALGVEDGLARVAIETRDATFFNRFGQLIYQEPLGRAAGNWLEVKESVACLDNEGPDDLRGLVLAFAAHLLVQTGKAGSLKGIGARVRGASAGPDRQSRDD